MSEPTLVPKQLETAAGIEKLTWTEIDGTYDSDSKNLMSYALFECEPRYSAWKTWADASGSAD